MLYDKKYENLMKTIEETICQQDLQENKNYKKLSGSLEQSMDNVAEFFRQRAESRMPVHMSQQKEFLNAMNSFWKAMDKLEKNIK
jgi:hypothetical protein